MKSLARRAGVLALSFILLTASAACADGSSSGDSAGADTAGHGDGYALYPKLPYVTGHIDRVEAQADNPRYFSRLLITDADRRQWEFRSDGWVGVSVGHLKDHQIQGAPVTVWYENRADGALLARFVGD